MNANQRRIEVKARLELAESPVSAASLAALCKVSRQIIVGDVALLRAEGCPITATPRGYLLQKKPEQNRCALACRHCKEELLDELYAIVDTGCTVLDVIVEHPVYGQMTGILSVASRYDADLFWQKLQQNKAAPLCQLTGDVHLHTIAYPSPAALEQCKKALAQKGYLLPMD